LGLVAVVAARPAAAARAGLPSARSAAAGAVAPGPDAAPRRTVSAGPAARPGPGLRPAQQHLRPARAPAGGRDAGRQPESRPAAAHRERHAPALAQLPD